LSQTSKSRLDKKDKQKIILWPGTELGRFMDKYSIALPQVQR
jgi:hypothetical protein